MLRKTLFRFTLVCGLFLAIVAGFGSLQVNVKYDPVSATMQVGVTAGMEAQAQICVPPACVPPPPPGGGGGNSATPSNSGNHGGNRFKVTLKSLVQMQGVSIACSAVVNIVDAWGKARGVDPRELTPVEAVNNAAVCGLIPAQLVWLYDQVNGIRDNACSLAIAREGLKKHNDPRFQEEMLFRRAQGLPPMADQAEFNERYHAAYTQPCVVKYKKLKKSKFKKKKKFKKIKVYRSQKLTS